MGQSYNIPLQKGIEFCIIRKAKRNKEVVVKGNLDRKDNQG